MKLRIAKIFEIIQSGGYFSSYLGNLEKKALTIIAIPLPGDNLPGFVSNLTSNVKKRN